MMTLDLRHHQLPAALSLSGLLSGCVEYGVSDDDDHVPDSLVVEEWFTQAAAPRVYVLWVIDNTASMAREQLQLAEAFQGFVEALEEEEVAYQLGVITTDVSDQQAGVLQGVPWVITPEHDDPVQAFSEAVQVGIEGAGPEAGLGAAWLATTEPLTSEGNRGFLRPDSLLHIVLVSDSDDHSEDLFEPWLSQGESAVDFFLDFLDERGESSGHAPIVSAVAGEIPTGCYGLTGRAQPANDYHAVVDATGGVFASICAGDMAPVLEGLGTASLIYADTFLLQAEPTPETIKVWVDGERVSDGWGWQESPSALVFEQPPPPDASILVRYTVAESAS
jgi:hypothetical protein